MGHPNVKVPASLKPHHAVVLDTNLLIYLFEDHPEFGAAAEFLFDQIAGGAFRGLVTPITLAQLVVKPLQNQRTDIADAYRSALQHMIGVELIAIDPETGVLAGALRAQYGLPLPDMMQAAAALRYADPVLVTQDARLRQIQELQVLSLDDFG